jgi:hypothetical protein
MMATQDRYFEQKRPPDLDMREKVYFLHIILEASDDYIATIDEG